MTLGAWMLPSLDDAAGRLAVALIVQRGHTTPAAAVALFRQFGPCCWPARLRDLLRSRRGA